MRRRIAGPRIARIRPIGAVQLAAMAGAVLLVAGCGAADTNTAAAAATKEAARTTVAAPASTVAPTTSAPAMSAAPQPVVVPDVVGLTVAQAKSALSGARLRWRLTVRRTTASTSGTVVAQSPGGDRSRNPDSVITLIVAQAPPAPKPTPRAEPTTEAPPAPTCHPSYVGACLDPNASDYDCLGGSGNGPKYTGRVTVVGPDVFDLDRDGDGIGCERD
jgi:resuscitation-promoting factor RpfB